MSALPPPPIQGWAGIPPVWRRWFQGLFTRVGGSTGRLVVIDDDGSDASALDELEARVRAAIPERPDTGALGARIRGLEVEAAGHVERPNVAALEARVVALEAAAAGRERADVAALERRVRALEVDAASRT